MAMAKREPRRPRDPPFCAAPRRRQALPRAEPAATPAAQLSPLRLRLATAQTVAPTSRCQPAQTVSPPAATNSGLSKEISPPQEARRPRAATSKMLSVAEELGQQGKALACNEARAEGPIGQNRLCRAEEEAAFVKPLNRPNSGKIRVKKSGLGKEVTGSKAVHQLLLKHRRARRRQSRNAGKLRATTGGTIILETLDQTAALGRVSPRGKGLIGQRRTPRPRLPQKDPTPSRCGLASPPIASTGISLDYERRRNSFWAFADLTRLPLKRDREFDLCAVDWSDLEFLSGEGPEAGTKPLTALEGWARMMRPTELLYLKCHDVEILMLDGTLVKVPGDLVYEHVLRRQPQPADAKSDEEAVLPRSLPARSPRSMFDGAVKI